MQKSTDGVGRRLNRPRPARRVSLAVRAKRRTAALFGAVGTRARGRLASPLGALLASAVRPFASAERALPVAVAAIVAVASLLALLPTAPGGTAGAAQGSTNSVRLAINGGVRYLDTPSDAAGAAAQNALRAADQSFQPVTLPGDVANQAVAEPVAPAAGVVLDDGTLVTGYAPETKVEDASALIQSYKVKKGDTLSTIASHFGISMMTLWWANKSTMKSKTDLHVGQTLRIPPATGLVITVGADDTLESLAARYEVAASEIIAINQLSDPTLVVGQVLVMPGAKGAPIATPKPVTKAHVTTRSTPISTRHGGTSTGLGGHYKGGRMSWPVVGGGNYVSQYYHYGHWAIDIAGDYGSKVVASAAGKVIFAGWKNNGGGWQVWISHGGNIYTTYNHMSGITVGAGQYVGRGQQVGRLGASGRATGPHLHFEVWVGAIWNGGQRMNPMSYL